MGLVQSQAWHAVICCCGAAAAWATNAGASSPVIPDSQSVACPVVFEFSSHLALLRSMEDHVLLSWMPQPSAEVEPRGRPQAARAGELARSITCLTGLAWGLDRQKYVVQWCTGTVQEQSHQQVVPSSMRVAGKVPAFAWSGFTTGTVDIRRPDDMSAPGFGPSLAQAEDLFTFSLDADAAFEDRYSDADGRFEVQADLDERSGIVLTKRSFTPHGATHSTAVLWSAPLSASGHAAFRWVYARKGIQVPDESGELSLVLRVTARLAPDSSRILPESPRDILKVHHDARSIQRTLIRDYSDSGHSASLPTPASSRASQWIGATDPIGKTPWAIAVLMAPIVCIVAWVCCKFGRSIKWLSPIGR